MPHTQMGLVETKPVSAETGFIALTCGAVFLRALHQARLVVTGQKVPENLGPGVYVEKHVPWTRGTPPQQIRAEMRALLSEVAARVHSRELPESGVFLEACNPTGISADDFMSKVCTSCRCRYCEISGG